MTHRRLVAYGCSLTAGTELGDHVGLNTTHVEVDRLKRSMQLFEWFAFEKDKALWKHGLHRSWAAHLACLLNLEFENRGIGGASLDQILLCMKNSLHRDEDLVIVGLTYIDRALKFENSTEIITKHSTLETACWNWYRALDQILDSCDWLVDIADCKAGLAFRYCENERLKQYCESVWIKAKPKLIAFKRPQGHRVHAMGHPHESWHEEVARQLKENFDE